MDRKPLYGTNFRSDEPPCEGRVAPEQRLRITHCSTDFFYLGQRIVTAPETSPSKASIDNDVVAARCLDLVGVDLVQKKPKR